MRVIVMLVSYFVFEAMDKLFLSLYYYFATLLLDYSKKVGFVIEVKALVVDLDFLSSVLSQDNVVANLDGWYDEGSVLGTGTRSNSDDLTL